MRIMSFAVLGVAVAPQHELFQDEEAEDAAEDRDRRLVRVALAEGVRDHLEEGGAEQSADGERHQHRDPARAQIEREGGERHGERAAGHACAEDPAERHGGGDST
jgi:hypothetical protein